VTLDAECDDRDGDTLRAMITTPPLH